LVLASEACREAKRPTTSRAFAERATLDFPKWAPGWVALGDISASVGDRAAAKRAYQTALDAEGPIDRDRLRKALRALR
jgi:predicted TPR repeat methyltransferase